MIAYIGIGSNLGDRLENLRAAVSKLTRIGEVIRTSPVYETTPVGLREQPLFLNAVVEVATGFAPQGMIDELLRIEKELGRDRNHNQQDAPRIIDLDLLLLGDAISSDSVARVPHPRMHNRKFVLQPLSDLTPELVHPVEEQTIDELLHELDSDEQVTVFAETL